jgi:hypothetical protein
MFHESLRILKPRKAYATWPATAAFYSKTSDVRKDFPGQVLAVTLVPAVGDGQIVVQPPWGGDNVMFH